MALIWNYLREWCLEVNIIFMEWENIGLLIKHCILERKKKKCKNDLDPGREVTQCRICGRYRRVLFVRDGWDHIIQAGLSRSLQFLLNWYSFLLEVGLKTTFLTWKTVKHLIRVLEFYWYLIYFNSDFGL